MPAKEPLCRKMVQRSMSSMPSVNEGFLQTAYVDLPSVLYGIKLIVLDNRITLAQYISLHVQ